MHLKLHYQPSNHDEDYVNIDKHFTTFTSVIIALSAAS